MPYQAKWKDHRGFNQTLPILPTHSLASISLISLASLGLELAALFSAAGVQAFVILSNNGETKLQTKRIGLFHLLTITIQDATVVPSPTVVYNVRLEIT